jgi:hypothetical protein
LVFCSVLFGVWKVRVAARSPFQSTTPGEHEEKDSDPNKNDVNSPGELTTIKIGC